MKMKFSRPDLVLKNYKQETTGDKLYPFVIAIVVILLIVLLNVKYIN